MDLRQLVLVDLGRAQRLIERVRSELDPQFRIASADGDWWIGLTLSPEPGRRLHQLGMVSKFMAWKSAPAFTQAVELSEPDAVVCVGCSHAETVGFLSMIDRKPLRFAEAVELTAAQIGQDVPRLLPRGALVMTSEDIGELQDMFGATGMFPAVHIPSGNIGMDG